MIRNSLILIPDPQPSNQICNFIDETINILSQSNSVIRIKHAKSFSVFTNNPFNQIIKNFLLYNSSKQSVITVQPVFLLPFSRFKLITKINYILYYWVLNLRLLFSKKRVIFWYFFPITFVFSPFKKFHTHYDCVDIIPESGRIPLNGGLTASITNRADTISTITHFQKRFLESFTPSTQIQVVPQGFNLDTFTTSFSDAISPHKKPYTVGFVGGINHRLDYKLLIKTATLLPDVSFVLCGPVNLNSDDQPYFKLLSRLPNTTILPPVSKNKVGQLISSFDAGMIPYKLNDILNVFSFPMKYIEYCYLGKPVIATPIPELTKYPEFTYTGKTEDEWREILYNLLQTDWTDTISKQHQFALSQTWKKKITSISNNI